MLVNRTIINRRGLGGMVVLSISGVIAAYNLVGTGSFNWIWILAVLSLPLIVCIAWIVGRSIYWMSGGERKIAVAYQGYQVPISDWAYTRQQMQDCIRNSGLSGRVSLRIVPGHLLRDDKRLKAFQRKYNFDHFFGVEIAPPADGKGPAIWQIRIEATIRKRLSREFVEATLAHAGALLSQPVHAKSLPQLLNWRATSTIEVIWLLLAVDLYSDGNYQLAFSVTDALDRKLAERCELTKYPRTVIRWLASQCLLQQIIDD